MALEENNPWKRRFERERQARKESEALLEEKSFELWEINQNLEKEVEERTQSLNQALLQAKNADNAKSAFLANISHEVRTPLNAIIGFSDVLKNDEQLNTQNRKYATIIESSAKSLLGIINDILDISKIENGNFDINIDTTNLFLISEHVIELFSNKASQKHINLIFDIDYNIPSAIETDGVRIRQVLSNIISNAIKFTPECGEITIKIQLLKETEDKVEIRFSVQDTGIGIPKEKQNEIFKPFFQVDHSSNREYDGTGLGLSICSHILNSLGSRIEIQSDIGEGTTFWFDLTCDISHNIMPTVNHYVQDLNLLLHNSDTSQAHYIKKYLQLFGNIYEEKALETPDVIVFACEENLQKLEELRQSYPKIPKLILMNNQTNDCQVELSSNEQALTLPFYASKVNDVLQELLHLEVCKKTEDKQFYYTFNGTILIAEDNYANQELIKLILKKMGIDFTIVDNGMDVVEQYKNGNFDLVLMDINIPVIDGVEAFKRIRTYEEENNQEQTPVVALTANAIKGDKEKFLNLGMNHYISKPIDLNKLTQLFLTYLESDATQPNLTQPVAKKVTSSLNHQKIMDTIGVDETIVEMLIDNFKKDIHKDMQELEGYIQNNEEAKIKAKAHYIKNSCLNLMLDYEVKLLQTIESEAHNLNLAQSCYQELKACIDSIFK